MDHRRRADSRSPSAYSFSTVLSLSALFATLTRAQDVPSSLQTITTPVPSPTSISSTISPTSLSPSTTLTTPTPSTVPNNNGPSHGFNYYFLVISLATVLFFLLLVYTVRRRRIKATMIRSTQTRALHEDVGGFRSPRYGRGWGWPADGDRNTPPRGIGLRGGRGRRRGEEVEGLDERGEAPPPYGVGSKPPSLRSFDGRCQSMAESARTAQRRPSHDVEMGDMARPRHDEYEPARVHWRSPSHAQGEPPAYQDPPPAATDSGPTPSTEMSTVTRPEQAVTRP